MEAQPEFFPSVSMNSGASTKDPVSSHQVDWSPTGAVLTEVDLWKLPAAEIRNQHHQPGLSSGL